MGFQNQMVMPSDFAHTYVGSRSFRNRLVLIQNVTLGSMHGGGVRWVTWAVRCAA